MIGLSAATSALLYGAYRHDMATFVQRSQALAEAA
jgi:hypothetical protein